MLVDVKHMGRTEEEDSASALRDTHDVKPLFARDDAMDNTRPLA